MAGISAGRPSGTFSSGIRAPGVPMQPIGGTPTGGVNPGGFTTAGMPGNTQHYGQAPGTAPVPGVTPGGRTDYIDPTGKWTSFSPRPNAFGGTDWVGGDPTDLWGMNFDRMKQIMSLFGGMGGGQFGGPQPTQGREQPGPAPARETPSSMADRQAAESAAFGRAKDRIGKLGQGALMALKDRSTAGGRSGSGLEAREERDVVKGATSQLGEVIRDQAINQLERADQIDDRNLGAGLTQRGQDIGMRSGDYSGQISQRGQDYGALLNPYQFNNPMLSMIPSMMSTMGSYGRIY